MPNHVTNRLVLTGPVEKVAEIKQLLLKTVTPEKPEGWPSDIPFTSEPEPRIDFNAVVPTPPILLKVIVPKRLGENGRIMLTDSDDWLNADEREATVEEQAEIDVVAPYQDWYDWSIDNWGTKWNGYSPQEVSDSARYEFTFETAWSAPTPIFNEVAKRYPEVALDIAWFDEGWMHAGQGALGHCATTGTSEGFYTEPYEQLYERVYGIPYLTEEQKLKETLLDFATPALYRAATNFTCDDVGMAMDDNGFYQVTAVIEHDDPIFDEESLRVARSMKDEIKARLGL